MLRSLPRLLNPAMLLPLTACCLFFSGCSATNSIDYGKVTLVDVSGTVTMDGEPLVGAVVTFENQETGTMSFARTDSSGRYTLQFDSEKDGVTPGKKLVRFSTTRTILGLKGEEGEEEGEASSEKSEGSEKRKEQVPECYNGKSELTVEVTPESSTINFSLKSDCSSTGADAG
jgi:hypothetical protein